MCRSRYLNGGALPVPPYGLKAGHVPFFRAPMDGRHLLTSEIIYYSYQYSAYCTRKNFWISLSLAARHAPSSTLNHWHFKQSHWNAYDEDEELQHTTVAVKLSQASFYDTLPIHRLKAIIGIANTLK